VIAHPHTILPREARRDRWEVRDCDQDGFPQRPLLSAPSALKQRRDATSR
jgi:hypothetical protein